jgi:hypothetical protein
VGPVDSAGAADEEGADAAPVSVEPPLLPQAASRAAVPAKINITRIWRIACSSKVSSAN